MYFDKVLGVMLGLVVTDPEEHQEIASQKYILTETRLLLNDEEISQTDACPGKVLEESTSVQSYPGCTCALKALRITLTTSDR